MESLAEWWIILGWGLAALIAPTIAALAGLLRPSRRLRRTTEVIALVTWLLWLAQYVVWANAHDFPMSGDPVPNELYPVHEALAHASAAGCVVLIPFAVAVVVTGRPARQPVREEN
ncbi:MULTISPECIES: hypothetical protein [unclassified Aeromicrobium]|uniref:hypothetical protein n=1 Tax=unclassified Aeromicrobium TaxID=2633570 RepID=UPI00396B1C82